MSPVSDRLQFGSRELSHPKSVTTPSSGLTACGLVQFARSSKQGDVVDVFTFSQSSGLEGASPKEGTFFNDRTPQVVSYIGDSRIEFA